MYSEIVMKHFENPQNVGEIKDSNAIGEVGNAKCGDIMKIYMKINPITLIIEDIGFKTFGCGAAIATSSMASALVKGKTIMEALTLTNQAVVEALDGLPPIKMHCSVLAEEAIKACIADFCTKNGITINGILNNEVKHKNGCSCAETKCTEA